MTDFLSQNMPSLCGDRYTDTLIIMSYLATQIVTLWLAYRAANNTRRNAEHLTDIKSTLSDKVDTLSKPTESVDKPESRE